MAEQNAFGDETDARLRAGDVFETDLVADFAAEFGFAFVSDASGEQASGEAAGLEDDDLTIAEQAGVQEHLRNLRRFAGAGRGGKDQAIVCAQSVDDLRMDFPNGKRVFGHVMEL